MIKIKIFSILTASILFLSACGAATPTATEQPTIAPTVVPTLIVENTPASSQTGLPQSEADVPRVSVDDAAAAIKSGEAIVLDVRSAEAYQASHIPGAMSIPLFDIENNPTGLNLDKDKWIITYCT